MCVQFLLVVGRTRKTQGHRIIRTDAYICEYLLNCTFSIYLSGIPVSFMGFLTFNSKLNCYTHIKTYRVKY